ncbi:MAG: anti-sigma factor family protein [Terriglobales bacterium]
MNEAELNCAQFEAGLSEYREGRLPPEEAAAVRQHANGCPNCAELLQAVASAQRQLAELPQLEPPARLIASILAQTQAAARRAPQAANGWNVLLRLRAALTPRFALGFAM